MFEPSFIEEDIAIRQHYAAEIEQLQNQLSSTQTEIQELRETKKVTKGIARGTETEEFPIDETQERTEMGSMKEMEEVAAVSTHKIRSLEAMLEREKRKTLELEKDNKILKTSLQEQVRRNEEC